MVARDSRPTVADLDLDRGLLALDPYLDGLAGRGGIDGVGDQVSQDPLDPPGVDLGDHLVVGQVDEQVDEAVTETGDKLKAELDDLLDEIDEVLETNAEDFVKSYVQKGGQ